MGKLGNVIRTLDWKEKFYSAYISSGQAADSGEDAEAFFRHRKAFFAHTIAAHAPRDKSARIVDLACGPGGLLYFLGRAGYRNIVGVDISEEQIAVAQRLGISSATCATLEDFVAAQSASSVDAIFLLDILEHMTRPEIMRLLESVHRLLRPDGRCIAHVPNSEGLFGMRVLYGDFTHEVAFTPTSARQTFRIAGFREVRCFEDRPRVRGPVSLARRVIWDVGTLPSRVLFAAETGVTGAILSQNMMIEAFV